MNTDRKPAELRLVNGPDTIVIRPRSAGALDPIMCKQWDLGSPEMRYTSVANPGADGVTYSEGFVGSRTVTLELAIMGGRDPITGISHDAYWYATKLTQMAHPKATPTLEISRADEISNGSTWSMELRGAPYSLPFTSRSGALLELQLTFTCPLGLIEGPLLCHTTPDSTDVGNTDLDFPVTMPFTFGLTGAKYPHVTMTIGGDSMVAPTVYIAGPVQDPDLRVGDGQSDGERFAFKGLTLPVGQTVQIDMAAGTVKLGDTATGTIIDDMSAYNKVDWAVSSFWQWLPGTTYTLLYRNTTGNATVQYRERRLTI